MCGRFSFALRPSQVRRYLEDANLPFIDDVPPDEGEHAPRQSYNFAPGYHGLVYRAQVPDWGAGPASSFSHSHSHSPSKHTSSSTTREQQQHVPERIDTAIASEEVRYELKTMKWGLLASWTKRNPDYGSMLKTINCRDDSLRENRGLWNAIKGRKRCVVVVQGFYEWLKKDGGREKVPHFVRRKAGVGEGEGDGNENENGNGTGNGARVGPQGVMLLAGLWDCCTFEGEEEKRYTFTIITTDSNPQLRFLHDRMPVILDPDSDALKTWLDPNRYSWSKELQSLLKPYEGELEVYPVAKEVGKVGNDSPNFILPVGSTENKQSIENFFGKNKGKKESKEAKDPAVKKEPDEQRETIEHEGKEDNAPLPVPKRESQQGVKHEFEDVDIGSEDHEPPKKVARSTRETSQKPALVGKPSPIESSRKTRSPTSNGTVATSPSKRKDKGSQKITSFFSK